MKLGLVQMSMTNDLTPNLDKSLKYCDMAKDCDLVFFPEIQLTPFFPQYEKRCVDNYCIDINNIAIQKFTEKAKAHNYYLSPNVYLESQNARYDASLWIEPNGEISDIAKMVHIAQNEKFYEQDYYTPSDDGFKVFHTSFGNVGIVICFDRHLPESIRTCALKGADLVIAPNGDVIIKADDTEQLLTCNIDLQEVKDARKKLDYLSLRRPEQYIG